MGDFADAEAASQAAYLEAAKVRAWNVAFSAANELVYNVGYRQARHAEGRLWAGHAEVMIRLAGDPLGLREASRLNSLIAVHQSSGAYAEAKELGERALAIREQTLGPEHPDVALSASNLGVILERMGAFAEAKALLQRSLDLREKALGPEHPDVAQSLNNLAIVYLNTAASAEAKALHGRALSIREKALGPAHPDVAHSLLNLASVHASTGEYAEAIPLLAGLRPVGRQDVLMVSRPGG